MPPSRSARGRERSERGMPCHPISEETSADYTPSLNPSPILQILVHIPAPLDGRSALWIPASAGMTWDARLNPLVFPLNH